MDKTYKVSAAAHVKSVAIKTAAVMFILLLLFIVAGEPETAFSMFNLVLVGVIVYEAATNVTVVVRMDGITVRTQKGSREYHYEMFYFASDGHGKLTAEDRRSGRKETIPCGGFDKKAYESMISVIKKAQTEYFLRRSASGDFKSGAAVKEDAASASEAERRENARRASAEASSRNPYSKNYKKNAVAETAAKSEPSAAKPAEPIKKPAEAKPAVTEIRSDIAVIEPVTASFEKEIPADYNKVPEIAKIDDSAYKKMPAIGDVTAKAAPVPVKDESFAKVEFRYPKREITERCERANALIVLWVMFGAVAAFLLWYLAAGIYTGGALMAALVIAALAAVCGLVIVQTNSRRARGIFGKLEITERFLVIDNTRYRWEQMTDKVLTPANQEMGTRRITFTCAGKRISYAMGDAKLSRDKRDIHVFPRYAELCRALKARGFKC